MSILNESVREKLSGEYDSKIESAESVLVEQILEELEERQLLRVNGYNTKLVERHINSLLDAISVDNRDVIIDEQLSNDSSEDEC